MARAALHAKHTHVLVDEFQDTNALQLRLLQILAPQESGRITVVGDDDQAIYGFQGATGSFAPFEAAYPRFQRTCLEQNYRSTAAIVRASSTLAACNSTSAALRRTFVPSLQKRHHELLPHCSRGDAAAAPRKPSDPNCGV